MCTQMLLLVRSAFTLKNCWIHSARLSVDCLILSRVIDGEHMFSLNAIDFTCIPSTKWQQLGCCMGSSIANFRFICFDCVLRRESSISYSACALTFGASANQAFAEKQRTKISSMQPAVFVFDCASRMPLLDTNWSFAQKHMSLSITDSHALLFFHEVQNCARQKPLRNVN